MFLNYPAHTSYITALFGYPEEVVQVHNLLRGTLKKNEKEYQILGKFGQRFDESGCRIGVD